MFTELTLKALIIVVCLVFGVASWKYFGLDQDNPIEEQAELVIEHKTGLVLDLSPASKEQ